MATVAIGSWYVGSERVVAVAVRDTTGERVYVRTMRNRSGRKGQLIIAPFETAEVGSLHGNMVLASINEQVNCGMADLRLESLGEGGRTVTERIWAESQSGHGPLTFAATLQELDPTERCPMGSGDEVFSRLMNAALAGKPTNFAIPVLR